MNRKINAVITLVILAFISSSINSFAAHGLAINGNLKYPDDFKKFEYTSDSAQKGGTINLHALGSFDKMNPFTLKGISPFGLEMFVFETLTVSSLDEPFSSYGLIASDIDVSDDKLSVTFTIDPQARFSDNTPVTAEDVKYSLETLKSDKAHPFYQMYFQDIDNAEIIDSNRIRFNFKKVNRELPLIAGQLPVLNKSFYEKNGFISSADGGEMLPPVASGPYIVDKINPGKTITYVRNKNYWARDKPVRKNMFNFDKITVKYFKDSTISLEAFKAGEFDFMVVTSAKQWARNMNGAKFTSGELLKKEFPHKNNAGMQGFVFNTRKKIFSDPLVRQAIGLAFDFEWANKTIFYNQYTRCNSYFSNSYLAATGLPEGKELALLEPFKDKVPEEVFTTPLAPPTTLPPNSLRKNLRQAAKLLKKAGWQIDSKDRLLKNKEGEPFEFEIILVSPLFERIMAPFVKNLSKLGIKATYRTIDSALYADKVKKFDFDMVVHSYGQSLSPGNEQRDFWTSAAADRQGSRNLAGIKNKVIDQLVDKVIYAQNQEELTTATHALDRVLWYGYYVVPNWYSKYHRIAYSKKLKQPDNLPLYYNPWSFLNTWWIEKK